jgi:hypothetical protein
MNCGSQEYFCVAESTQTSICYISTPALVFKSSKFRIYPVDCYGIIFPDFGIKTAREFF